MVSKKNRIPIPKQVQDALLIANRHSCCVCQKHRVQIHHIDSDPSNNDLKNLASLCLEHHDMATMTAGLTKKLKPNHVSNYKKQWEEKCAADITALARRRFTFYYCIYKNPQRIKEAYLSLNMVERKDAAQRFIGRLADEQETKDKDTLWGMNAIPSLNDWTKISLESIVKGEMHPSYLGKFKPHPADPDYSIDCSTQEAMSAYHLYDLWCQVAAQTLVEARGAMPLEDLYAYSAEDELDEFSGQLVTFKLSVTGKNIHIPRMWEQHPVGTLTARKKIGALQTRTRMQIRTMYLFSDTAASNLERGRVSGLGIFNGAVLDDKGVLEFTVVPLLIGSGGWNLHPEGYPKDYFK